MPFDHSLTVQYVVGRRRAMARAIAIHVAAAQGLSWQRLTQPRRASLVGAADTRIQEWLEAGVLAGFVAPYGEPEVMDKSLVEWGDRGNGE